jgi:hypothetical protein
MESSGDSMRPLLPILAAVLPVFAQVAGTVEGLVINGKGNGPVSRAIVELHGLPSTPLSDNYRTEADAEGRFRIERIVPGRYECVVERPDFILREPAPRFTLDSDHPLQNITLRLTPTGVIFGRITDTDGDPIRFAEVDLLRYSYKDGKKQPITVQFRPTDDRGSYRIYDVPPGTYYVEARASAPFETSLLRPTQGYATMFYPASRDVATAEAIRLAAGEEVQADIRLPLEPNYSIRGTVATESSRYRVKVWRRDRTDSVTSGDPVLPKKRFEICCFSPGSYFVEALEGTKSASRELVRQVVEINHADVDITLVPETPIAVSGTVRLEGAAVPGVRVELGPPGVVATTDAGGKFVLRDLHRDTYELEVHGPAKTYVKKVLFDDHAVTDGHVDLSQGPKPLSIILAGDVGRIEGSVLDPDGQPSADTSVTLIAVPEREDLFRTAETDAHGQFTIPDAAPGDYKIFISEDQMTSVTVTPNGTRVVKLSR